MTGRAPSADSVFTRLKDELDKWAAAGRVARFWWRDDDAAAVTPQLGKLLDVAREFGVMPAIAVIPKTADVSLADLLRSARCAVWQHGWNHRVYVDGEFGEGRRLESLVADILRGQAALDALFGKSGWQRVFVPPFHALALSLKTVLPILGYVGVSIGCHERPTPALATLPEVNAEVDLVDWSAQAFYGSEAICEKLVSRLRARRSNLLSPETPIGLLTHHLVHGDDVWNFLRNLFRLLQSHAAVEVVPAERLFSKRIGKVSKEDIGGAECTPNADTLRPGEVTVVVTSCGRHDLLQRTLDSFFKFNTHPIRRVVVIEDGPALPSFQALRSRYESHPVVWADTGERIGQIRAIDMAYRMVDTEYIFHCEDDWEFYLGGFIENSRKILDLHPEIVHVLIRPVNETYGRAILDYLLESDGVPFYVIMDFRESANEAVWHGFSFNPGLRRTRDYRLMGTYGSLDRLGEKTSAEMEREIGLFYRSLGIRAVTIADNGGAGYVRHIGDHRHVKEPARIVLPLITFRQHCRDLGPSFARAVKWRLGRLSAWLRGLFVRRR